jgi:hypothetical protein
MRKLQNAGVAASAEVLLDEALLLPGFKRRPATNLGGFVAYSIGQRPKTSFASSPTPSPRSNPLRGYQA